jgi:hypothetical protein
MHVPAVRVIRVLALSQWRSIYLCLLDKMAAFQMPFSTWQRPIAGAQQIIEQTITAGSAS